MKVEHKRYILALAVLAIFTMSVLAGIIFVRPILVFQKLVLDPVPKSVKNIRWTRKRSRLSNTGHTYVLGFDIDKADARLILSSEAFTEIEIIIYNDDSGSLTYGKDNRLGATVEIYRPWDGERKPKWFDFETWDSFKAYLVEEEEVGQYRMRLILHDEDLGRAYFIDHEINGTRQEAGISVLKNAAKE